MLTLKPVDFIISLEDILPSEKFVLKEVRKVFVYENNQKTDRVWGYRYKLVDPIKFETFEVKVEQREPIVSAQMLEESDKLWVSLEGAVIKPYKMAYPFVDYTIVAQKINLLKE